MHEQAVENFGFTLLEFLLFNISIPFQFIQSRNTFYLGIKIGKANSGNKKCTEELMNSELIIGFCELLTWVEHIKKLA